MKIRIQRGIDLIKVEINNILLYSDEDTVFCVAGQYDGRSKPLPEYHAKITGFDERVSFHLKNV